jgi:hypothetical protein
MLSPFEIEKEYKERWKKKFQNDIRERRNKEIEEVIVVDLNRNI